MMTFFYGCAILYFVGSAHEECGEVDGLWIELSFQLTLEVESFGARAESYSQVCDGVVCPPR
jgi:hypothetical protein